ncbi:MAG: DUF1565 domain-containing protein [Planctomycetota bacterium]|nr:MAG: DUF1565 domain-containing protein [Planctomycetota bacterium]
MKLLSFPILIAIVLFCTSLSAFAQPVPKTFYIDVTDTTSQMLGTLDEPYPTITYALAQNPNLVAGSILNIAPGTYPAGTQTFQENYPIELPAGIILQFWDINGLLPTQLPPPVVFQGPSSGGKNFAFEFTDKTLQETTQLLGYRNYQLILAPDTNQGFHITGFEHGIEIDPVFAGASFVRIYLNGVGFYQNRQAIYSD